MTRTSPADGAKSLLAAVRGGPSHAAWIAAGMGTAVAATLAAGSLVVAQQQARLKALNRAAQASHLVESIDHVSARFALMESSYQGYVISVRPARLDEARHVGRGLLDEARSLPRDRPDPGGGEARLARLPSLIARQVAYWESLAAAMHNDPGAGVVLAAGDEGVERAGRIRSLLDELDGIHKASRDAHAAEAERHENRFSVALLVAGLLQILVLALAWLAVVTAAAGRMRAEVSLHANEERFASLMELSSDWYWEQDEEHRLIALSPTFAAKTGLKDADVLGRTPWEVSFLKLPDEQWRVHRARLDAREPFEDFEVVHDRGNGRIARVSVSGRPYFDADGRFRGYRGASKDISSRKQAETALRASERRYRLLFDANPNPMWVYDNDTLRIVAVNEAAVLRYGYSREEFLSLTILDIRPAEDIPVLLDTVCRTEIQELRESPPRRHRRKSGEIIDVEVTSTLIDFAERPARLVLARDITDRKRAEERVAELARQQDAILDNALVGVTMVRNRSIVRCNQTMARMFGFAPSEMVGLSTRILYPSDDAYARIGDSAYGELLRTGTSAGEVLLRRKDGAEFWASFSVAAVDPNDLSKGTVWVCEDATARKQAQEAVRDLNPALERRVAERTAQLEAANRELEAFSYSVSHDLRAPLRAITGFAQAIEQCDGRALSEAGIQNLRRVQGNAHRMNQLIEDLLAFARLGRQERLEREIELTELAAAVLPELARAHPRAEIRLDELPRVSGDQAMLRQVFENLIGNALKFSAKRERPLVEIGAADTPQGRAVFVRDNGAGFDMTYAERLFQVFQRMHSQDEFEGTGVGLALVRRIVERHGGRIWADARPDAGASFYFTLVERSLRV